KSKRLERWCDADFSGDTKEVSSILTRHVCYAANLALLPKQAVIVKGGHLVQVNCVDCKHPTFVQRLQSSKDDIAHRCKTDCRVQPHWRHFQRVSNPGCPTVSSLLSVACSAGGDIDLTSP